MNLRSIAASIVLAQGPEEENPGLEDPGLEDPGLEDPGLEDPTDPSEGDPTDPSILAPATEYSVQIDLSVIADFEGQTTQTDLVQKFKEEIVNAIRNSMALTASGLGLTAVGARVKPIDIQCEISEEFDPE